MSKIARDVGWLLLDPSGYYCWDYCSKEARFAWCLVGASPEMKDLTIWPDRASALVEAKRLAEVVKIDVRPTRLHLPG